jgi:hypothetical protein
LSKNIKIGIYKTIILPVVLCECETWSVTKREEHKVRVFENMLLRRIFGPKRNEETRVRRKLHNEELHRLYSLPNIIRIIKSVRMRWTGYVARVGEKRNTYRILVGKPEGKSTLGRSICSWVDKIKMDLRETGWNGMDWINLAQDRGSGGLL